MGEFADDDIERMIDGSRRNRPRTDPPVCVMCNLCRSAAVRWLKDRNDEWKLYDSAWMHPRRKTPVPHICQESNLAEGFTNHESDE